MVAQLTINTLLSTIIRHKLDENVGDYMEDRLAINGATNLGRAKQGRATQGRENL